MKRPRTSTPFCTYRPGGHALQPRSLSIAQASVIKSAYKVASVAAIQAPRVHLGARSESASGGSSNFVIEVRFPPHATNRRKVYSKRQTGQPGTLWRRVRWPASVLLSAKE